MKKLLFSALALLVASLPFSSMAGMGAEENINIYGWQNYSWEYVSVDNDNGGDYKYDRIVGNSAHLGFKAHLDTGLPGLKVGMRCESATSFERYEGRWCGRESKISLRHDTLGEIMFATWLLPYNQIVAQWVDPFYDAGSDSHTSIMGNIGFRGNFYAPSLGAISGGGSFNFNRRQEEIVQYVWPNTDAMGSQSRDGFQFRFAITTDRNEDQDITGGTVTPYSYNLEPRIWSTGAAWQHKLMNDDQIWLAVAYERHDDWTAYELSRDSLSQICKDSEDDGWRLAGRYTRKWDNGMDTMVAAMWEELDYDADDCVNTLTGNTATNLWSDVDRDAWMISGKHGFGNGWAVKFSYMDADDLDCGDEANCGAVIDDGQTDADAWNLGLTYTAPAGTELRVTYSDVDNSSQSDYDLGIFGSNGQGQGEDVDMWAIGIIQWFD